MCEVTTTGTATLLRLGLYAADADWQPGALIVDGGTVDATGTGNKSASVNVVLQPGNYLAALNANNSEPRSDQWRGDGRAAVGHLRRARGRQPGRRCHRHANLWRSCRRRVRRLSWRGLSAGNTAPVHVMLMVWSYP